MTQPRGISTSQVRQDWMAPFGPPPSDDIPWFAQRRASPSMSAPVYRQLPFEQSNYVLDPYRTSGGWIDYDALPGQELDPHIYSPNIPGGGGQLGLTQGESRDERDPARAGINVAVSNMLRNRWGKAEIEAYLTRRGVDLKTVGGLDKVFRWQSEHPRYRGNYSVELEMRSAPMSDRAAGLNRFLQSPTGTALATSADTMFGGLDNFSDNPDLTRQSLNALKAENPTAAAAGGVMGGAATAAVAEPLLAYAGVPALAEIAGVNVPLRALGTDAVTGGLGGAAGSPSGEKIEGALRGIGKGLLLGQATRPASDYAEAALGRTLGEGIAKSTVNIANSGLGYAIDDFSISPRPRSLPDIEPIPGVDMVQLYELLDRNRAGRPSSPSTRWKLNR